MKFTNQALHKTAGYRTVVTAVCTRILESTAGGYGHRATAKFPVAGVYGVAATVHGKTVCAMTNDTAATVCMPDVTIQTGPAHNSSSLVLGTGTIGSRTANQTTGLTVVPVDSAGNALTETGDHGYALSVKCVVATAQSSSLSVGDVVVNALSGSYDTTSNDGTHVFTGVSPIQTSGVYEYSVTQTTPVENAGVVTKYNVTVTPASVSLVKFLSLTANALNESVVVGADESHTFAVYDSFGNQRFDDLTRDMRITMSAAAANEKPRTLASSSSENNSGPLRVTFANGNYSLAYNVHTAGAYSVTGVSIGSVFVPADQVFNLVATAGRAVAATTTVLGGASHVATAGVVHVFPVFVADRYGNILKAPEAGLTVVVHAAIVVHGYDPVCDAGKVTAIVSADATGAWNVGTGRYEVTYKSDVAGVLSIRVSLSGGGAGDAHMGAVIGSPYFIDVKPAATTAAQSTVVTTTAIETVDSVASFSIIARDAFGNEKQTGGDFWFVDVVDTAGGVVSPSVAIVDHGDGSYTASWTPTVALSTYEIRVLLSGAHVANSPVAVTTIAASSVTSFAAAKTVAIGTGAGTAVAGSLARFVVYANDANGARLHAGGVTFAVTLTHSSGSTITFTSVAKTVSGADGGALVPGEGIVVDNADGTYKVLYVVSTSGSYDLAVTSGGVDIKGTWPVSVTAFPGSTSAVKSTMQLGTDPHQFPSTSLTGATITTRISALDATDNARCYSADGDGRDDFAVTVTKDGVSVANEDVGLTKNETKSLGAVDVAVTPKTPGNYVVSVSLDSVEIAGSPATVTVSPNTMDAVVTGATFTGNARFGGRVGVSRTGTLTARDANGNKVVTGLSHATCATTLTPDVAGHTNSTAACVLTDSATGLFTVTLLTYDAGTYTLNVTMGGAVSVSRTGVHFVPGRAVAPRCTAAGTGVVSVESGDNASFTVSALDGFGNKRAAGGDSVGVVVGGASAALAGDVGASYGNTVDNADGTYTVTYAAPKFVGTFGVEVTLGGSPIAGSPFSVSALRAATDGALSFVKNAATEVTGIAGEVNTFVVIPVNSHGAPQPFGDASTSGDRFSVTIAPGGDSFGRFTNGSVALAVAEADGGGFAVNWIADRVLHASDGTPATYTINVTLGGVHVFGSPFAAPLRANVASAANGGTALRVSQIQAHCFTEAGDCCPYIAQYTTDTFLLQPQSPSTPKVRYCSTHRSHLEASRRPK